jgi:hypothetical protein
MERRFYRRVKLKAAEITSDKLSREIPLAKAVNNFNVSALGMTAWLCSITPILYQAGKCSFTNHRLFKEAY